jgi:hypothetical protein
MLAARPSAAAQRMQRVLYRVEALVNEASS